MDRHSHGALYSQSCYLKYLAMMRSHPRLLQERQQLQDLVGVLERTKDQALERQRAAVHAIGSTYGGNYSGPRV